MFLKTEQQIALKNTTIAYHTYVYTFLEFRFIFDHYVKNLKIIIFKFVTISLSNRTFKTITYRKLKVIKLYLNKKK